MKHFIMFAVVVIFMNGSLYGQAETPMELQVKNAGLGGKVTVSVHNKTTQVVRIWQYDSNSWGWGNWTFEFFDGNELVIFVRNPDEGFTVNVPFSLDIPASGFVDQSFNLADGSWVSHRIPIAPTYPSKEEDENGIRGCFAILAIPPSGESKEKNVWTGTAISPLQYKLSNPRRRNANATVIQIQVQPDSAK